MKAKTAPQPPTASIEMEAEPSSTKVRRWQHVESDWTVKPFGAIPLNASQCAWLLAALTVITRLVCSGWSIGPTSAAAYVQSVNSMGLLNGIPPAPGGLFLVAIAKLLNAIGIAPLSAFLLLNALFAAMAVYYFVKLAARWYGVKQGLLAGALFAVMPAFFYHSTFATSTVGAVALLIAAAYYLTSEERAKQDIGSLLFGATAGFNALFVLLLVPFFLRVLVYLKRRDTLPGRRIAALVGLAAIGIAAWKLTMIMLLGTRDFVKYLTPSIDNILTRENPLLFIGFALLTLTVLPFLVMRTHAETDMSEEQKLMRGWAVLPAAAFLFVKADFEWTLVLLPPMILSVLNRYRLSPKRHTIMTTLIAAHLLLFFVLPSMKPVADTTLARSRRTSSPLVTLFSRMAAFNMPSYQHILDIASGEEEAVSLIRNAGLTDTTSVILEPSITRWTNERALETIEPRPTYYFYNADRLNRVHVGGGKDTSFVRTVFGAKRAVTIIDKDFAREYLDTALKQATKIGETKRLELYELPPTPRKDFIDQLIFLYYQSMHG